MITMFKYNKITLGFAKKNKKPRLFLDEVFKFIANEFAKV
jgi:hypothetical protein